MESIAIWLKFWMREQKASLDRIEMNIRQVFMLLPIGILEAIINLSLALLIIPFIFSRALDTFIGRAFILYRTANDEKVTKSLAAHKWPLSKTKAEKIALDFSIKEDKFIQGFVAKTLPFVFGVITTLLTLYLTDEIKH